MQKVDKEPQVGEVWHLTKEYTDDKRLVIAILPESHEERYVTVNIDDSYREGRWSLEAFSHLADDQSHDVTLAKSKRFEVEVGKYYKFQFPDTSYHNGTCIGKDPFSGRPLFEYEDEGGQIIPALPWSIEEVDPSTQELKLEVGKVYVNEKNERVLIKKFTDTGNYAGIFLEGEKSGDLHVYKEDGSLSIFLFEKKIDLVKLSNNQSREIVL